MRKAFLCKVWKMSNKVFQLRYLTVFCPHVYCCVTLEISYLSSLQPNYRSGMVNFLFCMRLMTIAPIQHPPESRKFGNRIKYGALLATSKKLFLLKSLNSFSFHNSFSMTTWHKRSDLKSWHKSCLLIINFF